MKFLWVNRKNGLKSFVLLHLLTKREFLYTRLEVIIDELFAIKSKVVTSQVKKYFFVKRTLQKI